MSSYQIFEPDIEFNDEDAEPKPKPKPSPSPRRSKDQLWAEAEMWKARALQNRSENRALRAENAGRLAKANREAANLRVRLHQAQDRIAELEGDAE